jgi:hypothetical protein
MDVKQKGRGLLAACLAVGCLTSVPTMVSAQPASSAKAAEGYQAHLGPTPVPDGVRSAIMGEGSVSATLNGQNLQVEGQFAGTGTTATEAFLMQGTGIGIPGPAMLKIGVTPDGKISGTAKLSRDQLAALRAGYVYVQVNSDKFPAPQGQLFGWLLPAHAAVVEGEPQLGRGFMPQGLGLKKPPPPRGRKS